MMVVGFNASSLIALIKKSDLGDANKAGDSVSIKRNGIVGMVDRFTIYRTNNLKVSTVEGLDLSGSGG